MSTPERRAAIEAEIAKRQRRQAIEAEIAKREAAQQSVAPQAKNRTFANAEEYFAAMGKTPLSTTGVIPSDLFEPGTSQVEIETQLRAPGQGQVINPTVNSRTGLAGYYPDAPEGSGRDKAANWVRGYDKQTEAAPSNRLGSDAFQFATKGVPNALRGTLADFIDNPAQAVEDYTPIGPARTMMDRFGQGGQELQRGNIGNALMRYGEGYGQGALLAAEAMGARGAGRGVNAVASNVPQAPAVTRRGKQASTLNAVLGRGDIDQESIKLLERFLKTEDRVLDDVTLRRLQSVIQDGSGVNAEAGSLPTRFKDVLVDQVDGPSDNLQKRIYDQLKGTAAQPGGVGQVVFDSIDADLPASRDYLKQALRSRLGERSLLQSYDDIGAELQQIGREGYEPLLKAGPQSQEGVEALNEVLAGPGASKLFEPLRTIAAGEGIDLDTMLASRPLEAAHWMQSKARQLATSGSDEAQKQGYKALRTRLLTAINKAAPGYDDVRKQYGDAFGTEQALEFGRRFLNQATRDLDVDLMARDFENLSPSQKEAALLSVRDTLLSEATKGRSGQAPRLTRLDTEQTTQALRRVFGDVGDDVANEIEKTSAFVQSRRAIDPRNGSQTTPLGEAVESARGNVQSTARRKIGGAFKSVGGDAGWSSAFGGVAPVNSMQAAMRGLGNAIEGDPSRKMKKLAELLETPIPRNVLGDAGNPPSQQLNTLLPENTLNPLGPSVQQNVLAQTRR